MKIKRGNRKDLSTKERTRMWADQKGLCGCGCGERLNDRGKGDTGEHVWWFVALGNSGKPDKLYRKECAKRKTNGPRGDINTISHIKQLAEGRTQHDRRNERGYSLVRSKNTLRDSKLKKKLSGEVVQR